MADEKKLMANIPPFGLRMQPEMKARLEASAKEYERSLNSEIVLRLQQSLDGAFVHVSGEGLGALIKRLEATVDTSDILFLRIKDEVRRLQGKAPNSGAVEISLIDIERLQQALEDGDAAKAKVVLERALYTQKSPLRKK